MRAACLVAHGGLEVVQILELDEVQLQPGTVMLDVQAVALNHLDLWVRQGWQGLKLEMPHVLGSDIAARVAAVASDVEGFAVNDAVLVSPGFGCGSCAHCIAGRENLCRHHHIYGESVHGGLREHMCVPASHLFAMPTGLTWAQAAAIPLTFTTAWHMLVVRAGLCAGETVLVQGGASGVGTAAVQIAVQAGARVIATGSTVAKREHCLAIGAHAVVDQSVPGWHRDVRRLSDTQGVDVVVEHVGGEVFESSLACLRPGGRLVTCGATIGAQARIDLRHVFFKQLSILGSTMGTRADMCAFLPHIEAKQLIPVVHAVYPLDAIHQAQQALEQRAVIGKIVVDVSGQANNLAKS